MFEASTWVSCCAGGKQCVSGGIHDGFGGVGGKQWVSGSVGG